MPRRLQGRVRGRPSERPGGCFQLSQVAGRKDSAGHSMGLDTYFGLTETNGVCRISPPLCVPRVASRRVTGGEMPGRP